MLGLLNTGFLSSARAAWMQEAAACANRTIFAECMNAIEEVPISFSRSRKPSRYPSPLPRLCRAHCHLLLATVYLCVVPSLCYIDFLYNKGSSCLLSHCLAWVFKNCMQMKETKGGQVGRKEQIQASESRENPFLTSSHQVHLSSWPILAALQVQRSFTLEIPHQGSRAKSINRTSLPPSEKAVAKSPGGHVVPVCV